MVRTKTTQEEDRMKTIRIRLLKAWKAMAGKDGNAVTHPVGTVLEVEESIGKELIAQEAAVEDDPVGEGLKAAEAAEAKATETAVIVKSVLDEIKKDSSDGNTLGNAITKVKDTSDLDPLAGYGPEGHTFTLTDFADGKNSGVLQAAVGNFMADMAKGKTEVSEKLAKTREVSDAMLQKAAGSGMIVGDDEHGGYFIMPALSMMLATPSTLSADVVKPLATVVPMEQQLLKLPRTKHDNETGNTVFGGIQFYWDDENAQSSESRPEQEMLELKLHKLTGLAFTSEEWVRWSPATIGGYLIPLFVKAKDWTLGKAYFNGGGASMPVGLSNSKGAVSVTKETSQTADTIVRQNLDKMFSRLLVKNPNNVRWFMNRTCFTQLPGLNVTVGTGGSAIFVQDITGAPRQSLYGYPIEWTDFCPVLGDAKDVILADVSDYLIGEDRRGSQVSESTHLKFDYGQTAIRIVTFTDGQNATDTAFTPHKAGSTAVTTRSTVVTLGART